MTDDNFEKLARRHPALFQKAGDFEFSIGDGWFDIVDVLCAFLSHNVESQQRKLKYAMENPNAKMNEPISVIEAKLANYMEELPTLTQVKEKFGTMRFYVDGGTDEMRNYIELAEAMTGRTCELCGDRGGARTGGWIRVLCDKHSRIQDEKGNDTSWNP